MDSKTRIKILAGGTLGHVQLYIALGLGLKAAGHTVQIAAASNADIDQHEQRIRVQGEEA